MNSFRKPVGGGKIFALFSMLALTVPMPGEASLHEPVAAGMEAAQQTMTLTGVVRDENGDPVPGASVYVKGNNKIGTVTDIDGRFSLKVAPGQILVVSFIGYETIEEPVRPGRTFLELSLHADDTQLSEVVVTGY